MEPELADLLKGKDETEYSAYDIESKAHNRWSKKQFRPAALLFEAAARVSLSENGDRCQFLNYQSRAGICYSQGGKLEKAKPLLKKSIEADWIGAGLEKDMHMIEWCYVELLCNESQTDAKEFDSLFEKAKAHCANLGWVFPKIHPKQEALLEVAVSLGLDTRAAEIVSLIRSRKPISRATRARLKEIEASLA